MICITERIINLSVFERKIHNARTTAEMLPILIEKNDHVAALKLAKELSLQLHELEEFDLVIERRKTAITDSQAL